MGNCCSVVLCFILTAVVDVADAILSVVINVPKVAETDVITPEVVESEGVAPEEDELIVVALEVLSWKLILRKR